MKDVSLRCVARLIGVAGLALVGACGWFEGAQEPPLPGERISVLSLDNSLKPDARLADLEVRLPRPAANAAWPQAGGNAGHAMHHLAAEGKLTRLWRADIGRDATDERPLLAAPVVAGGRVFTVDVEATVSAFDLDSGTRIWRRELVREGEDEGPLGGGIAIEGDRVFVATGFAEVIALNAESGEIVWRKGVEGPLRSPPTIHAGRVYVMTIANRFYALNAANGAELWTHTGITETAGLLGGGAAAADGEIVVVPYSSGELFALRATTGRVVWQDSLSSLRRTDPVSAMAHIKGAPAIDRGQVFAVSHSGRMVAFDLLSGRRIWERPIGGTQPPWIAGDFIFVISNLGELACLSRRDGGVRWVHQLQRFEDEEDREDPIMWSGPVLVSDRLLVAGSNSEVLSVSPYTGKLLGRISISGRGVVAPVVARETVLLLTDDAELIALR